MHDLSVEGDDDRWMVLERTSAEGLPLVVRSRVNPVVAEFAEGSMLSVAVIEVAPAFVSDTGMPRCMDELYDLEDAVTLHLSRCDIAVYHTASITGDGKRVLYFAHGEEFDFSSMVCDSFPAIARLTWYSEVDFEEYRSFVTPSPLDWKFDGDRRVISQLQESGDDGIVSRKVDFWFYGAGPGIEKLAGVLGNLGFAVDHWLEEPAGVVMSVDTPADRLSFRKLTPLLVSIAADCGVDYEGWETLVVPANHETQLSRPAGSIIDGLLGQRKH